MLKLMGDLLFRLLLWALFPLSLFLRCICWPCFWVLKHGWINTPFWHNVKAGWIQSVELCFK